MTHIELVTDCGADVFETTDSTFVVIWNYKQTPELFYSVQQGDAEPIKYDTSSVSNENTNSNSGMIPA